MVLAIETKSQKRAILMNIPSLLTLSLLLTGMTPALLAKGRYAKAELNKLSDVIAWVEQDPSRYWIQGENAIFFADEKSKSGQAPFDAGRWTLLKDGLFFYFGAHDLPEGSQELLRGGRVRLIASKAKFLPERDSHHRSLRPIIKNSALVETKAMKRDNPAQSSPFTLSQWIDDERWRYDVEKLAGWNRYSYAADNSLAREWLAQELAALPGFEVSDFSFAMPRGTGVNVLGQITGKSRPDEIYIVGAHYDSTSEKPSSLAPGAEDNATGTAGMLAIARVFAEHPPEATILFVGFSGEEQGLYGSKAWTKQWIESGKEKSIKAALIMDMIGYSSDAELDLLLETSRLTQPLLDDIAEVHNDPELVLYESFNYWGSDHEPFLDNGIPAILFIENDYLNYPSYHRSTDTIEKIHPELGPKIIRLMTDSLALWVY
jgi:hypothetical protein